VLKEVGRIKSVMNDFPTNCVQLITVISVWKGYARTIVSKNIIILCVLK